MSAPTQARRLQVLFLVALLGVLAAAGVLVGELLGGRWAVGYAVLAAGLVLVGAARARAAQARAQEQARRAAGRTCTCCTSSHADPVRVV